MKENFKLLLVLRQKTMTQKTLAKLSHINENFISMIVRGLYNPNDDQKSKIAKALKVRIKDVF